MNERKVTWFVIGLFCFTNLWAKDNPVDLSQVAQDYFKDLVTFKSEFVQNSTNPINNALQYFTGKIYLKKTNLNQFRFEYDPPNEQLIIGNGQYIWMVDYDLEQITRYQQENLEIPIAKMLTNPHFELLQTREFNGVIQSYFRTSSINSNQDELVLVFNDDELHKIVSQDTLGNLVVFELSGTEKNQNLDDGLFELNNENDFELIEVR